MVGAAIVLVMALAAIVGPSLTPFDPAQQELPLRLAGPTWRIRSASTSSAATSWRGCWPARASRSLSAMVVVSVSAGSRHPCSAPWPAISAARWTMSSAGSSDTLLAFPGLLLAIALVAVLGPSLGNVLFALTIIGWVGYARLVRGQVLRAREFEYVQAARALGAQHVAHAAPSHHPQRHAGGGRAGDARHGGRDSR